MSNKLIPGLSVTDGFDFVRKIWGNLPIPSAITPTTDLAELDKRINDLRAVEQWLNINISMLRATIQGLEVQRGTIATLKSFGGSLVQKADGFSSTPVPPAAATMSAQAMAAASGAFDSMTADAKAASAEATANLVSGASAWWGLLQEQLSKVADAALSATNPEKEADEKKSRPLAGDRPPIRSAADAQAKVSKVAKPRAKAPKTAGSQTATKSVAKKPRSTP